MPDTRIKQGRPPRPALRPGRLPRVPAARLLNASGHDRDVRHATWLELFFDLVFVAAIGQLASSLQRDATVQGLARFAALFVVVWWVWLTLTTYADRFGANDRFHLTAMLVAMLLGVGLAASTPEAFQGDTTPFAVAYVLVKCEQLVLFERARRQSQEARALYGGRVAVGLFSAACWIASLAVTGWPRYALWTVAIGVEIVMPWLSISAARRAPLNVWHLPERFGLFSIIVLGESVARLVDAATQRQWSVQLCVVLAAAFGTIAAMWWISFNAMDHTAVRRGRRATLVYMYTQLPMVAGIAGASAGLHRAILAAAGPGAIPAAPRAAIYGGASLYLLAAAVLPAATARQRARRVRLAAAAAALALVVMGSFVAPVFLVPALTLVMVAEIALDSPRLRRSATSPSVSPAGARPAVGSASAGR
jgi:low temperature requirement protein LtrA